jgi:ABC-type spermidine/putrescine transport system permease subunit II
MTVFRHPGRAVLIAANVLVYAILLFPLLIVVASSFTSGAGVDFPPREPAGMSRPS